MTDTRGNQNVVNVDVQVNIGNRAPTPNAGGGLDADGNVVGPYVIAVVPDPNNAGQYVLHRSTMMPACFGR